MSKLKSVSLLIAAVGALVGFLSPASAPVITGLGKAIFGVFFEIFLIAYLVGGLEASGGSGKAPKTPARH